MASPKLEPVVLTDEERQVLEGWARRRKTAQALALRSRIVLACADGGSVSDVAAELGISRTTAGKWRSRFLESRLDGAERRAAPGPAAHDHRRARREGDRRDAGAGAAERGHPLVHPVDGQVSGPEPDRGLPDLAGVRAQAARRADLEAVHGPAVHRQGPRRRRPVHEPAGERPGAVRGREVADPGPGPDRPLPADAAHDARRG